MDSNEVRDKRGISKEVWDARPYKRWTAENYSEAMAAAYTGLTGKQIGYMKRLTKQHPGWVINRHAVPGAPYVYPEIRPDGPVRTGPPVMHWHGVGEPPEELPPTAERKPGAWYPDGGYRVLKRGSDAWKKHCEKINSDENEEDVLHELNTEPHTHANEAKYVFPPAERVVKWANPHDHASKHYTKNPDKLEAHIEDRHGGHAGEFGEHSHSYDDKSDEALARRLDIHPMALERLADAERIYFGIEGCLKADAILSAIIAEDRPESVFSVPSVSLWAAPEFDRFIPALRGKQVVIVPDADWFEKPQVLRHARFAQRYLERRGVEAYIAAPPRAGLPEIKGVDDFLGPEGGGTLDELEVLERVPSEHIPGVLEYRRRAVRRDAWESIRGLVYDLSFFADPRDEDVSGPESKAGYVYATLRTLAKILAVGKSTVADNLHRMRDFDMITIEHLYDGDWINTKEVKTTDWIVGEGGRTFKGELHFEHTTRIRVHERLRGTDLEPFPLAALERRRELVPFLN